MALPTFKVGPLDITEYIRFGDEDGFDLVNAEHQEPQFAGSAAFSEGLTYVTDAIGNRVWTVPLILDSDSTDNLHALIRQIRSELTQGTQIEFKMPSATDSTYWTLERGKIEEQFQYFLAIHNRTRAVLKLWTRPLGRIATPRTIASFQSTGPVSFPATGILGDVNALANLEVRVGSQAATSGRLIAYGVHPHPSFNALRHAASIGAAGGLQASSVPTIGASGAVGSMYAGIPISPTTASGIALREYLTPPDAHVGRHRVFAILRSGLYPANSLKLYAKDRFGAVLGPTITATQYDQTRWMVADLGEIQVQARASGQEAVPTQYIDIFSGGGSGASVVASPGLRLNQIQLIPLDVSPGMLRTEGVSGAQSALYSDTFSRFPVGTVQGNLDVLPAPDTGQVGAWRRMTGTAVSPKFFGRLDGGGGAIQIGISMPMFFPYVGTVAAAGATTIYSLGSGVYNADVHAQLSFRNVASSVASGQQIRFYPKAQPAGEAATVGMWTELNLGPSSALSVALFSHDGSATTLHASRSLATVCASAIFNGVELTLAVRTNGPEADVWVATQGGLSNSPIISASHANLSVPGNPILAARQGGGTSALIDNVIVNLPAASLVDSGPREWFRFESHPEQRTALSNASVFKSDTTPQFRGAHPRLPVAGPSGASGPARVIVMQGEIDNFVGNDPIDIRLDAIDRFNYQR